MDRLKHIQKKTKIFKKKFTKWNKFKLNILPNLFLFNFLLQFDSLLFKHALECGLMEIVEIAVGAFSEIFKNWLSLPKI